jgi:hypothetical protein
MVGEGFSFFSVLFLLERGKTRQSIRGGAGRDNIETSGNHDKANPESLHRGKYQGLSAANCELVVTE